MTYEIGTNVIMNGGRRATIVEMNGIGNICDLQQGRDGSLHLREGDKLAVDFPSQRYGSITRTFTLGSVPHCAMEDGMDPVEAIERAKKHGHDMHWINANGAMIHNGPRSEVFHIRLAMGQRVDFWGRVWTIEQAPNNNLKLVEVQS